MSAQVNILFHSGLRVLNTNVHPSNQFATLTVGEIGDDALLGTHPTLFFHRVEDIETLVGALQQLGNQLAAAQPDEPERELPAEAYETELSRIDRVIEEHLDQNEAEHDTVSLLRIAKEPVSA